VSARELPAGTVTFLFTDVEGSTRLLQEHGPGSPSSPGQIGVDLGLIRPTNYVALVAAGLLSVIVFPLVSLTLLRNARNASETDMACAPSSSLQAS
jgi:mannitol-specific phosphotransferase system IIBC component